ncbi:pathogenesis-related protein PRMS-like [Oryza brachyantha]|uniref:pathogenesis-related protein PRMS-like n=1 Tax=Oryza brachyantha TaxID=4533 RepID=UPI001ADC1401|nr:pathogenesis-related protein PRMS-like [Oryza brachyantha]
MTSRVSCLAVILSLLALSSAAAAVVPRGPTTVAKFLSAVNDVRRQAGAPPLAWNATVARRAKQSAVWLRSSGGCDLAQNGRDPSGNTGGARTYFLRGGRRVSPKDAVWSWAEERRWYDAGTGACAAGKQCGDYRIMVRPASTQLGCAVAVCASSVSGSGSDKTIMVCEYYPGH